MIFGLHIASTPDGTRTYLKWRVIKLHTAPSCLFTWSAWNESMPC